MLMLAPEQISQFFHRSYKSVDGLWFMKVEKLYGFDAALRIDREVWLVMPKIQARFLKSAGGLKEGMDSLFECLTTKLILEGFEFSHEKAAECFSIFISTCPWHDLRVKSKRENISGEVGDVICEAEYSVWAKEFGDDIVFERGDRICKGAGSCTLRFCRV
jgi:hypothetical protein